MKLFCAVLAFLSLGVQESDAYYFNLGGFLEPILNPRADTFGQARYRINDRYESARFDERQNSQTRSFSGNLRRSENVASDLYKAVGIPQDIIYNKLLPVHMAARRDLNRYFFKHNISSRELFQSLHDLKVLINWVTKTYLENVDNLIIGDNNDIKGHHIFLKGSDHKVVGSQNFVFNPNFGSVTLKGDNIVRIGKFDVDLDKIDEVKRDPYKAVQILKIQDHDYY